MNDRTKVILAFFILLISAVSLNLNLTGNVIREETIVSINPKSLSDGDVISIEIKPGIKGVDPNLQFYKGSGLRVHHLSTKICKYYKCYDDVTINKRLNLNTFDLDGNTKMYVQVNDLASDRPIRVYFTVESNE